MSDKYLWRVGYDGDQHILDPQHYLSILGRKPAYLDHTAVFGDWQLPQVFNELRTKLEQVEGASRGAPQTPCTH